jgi:hypothetical protein
MADILTTWTGAIDVPHEPHIVIIINTPATLYSTSSLEIPQPSPVAGECTHRSFLSRAILSCILRQQAGLPGRERVRALRDEVVEVIPPDRALSQSESICPTYVFAASVQRSVPF